MQTVCNPCLDIRFSDLSLHRTAGRNLECADAGQQWSRWTILSSVRADRGDRNRSIEKRAGCRGRLDPVGGPGLGKDVADVPPDRVAGDE